MNIGIYVLVESFDVGVQFEGAILTISHYVIL